MRRTIWALCLLCLLIGFTGFSPAFGEVLSEFSVPDELRYKVAFFSQSIPIYLYKDVVPQANVDVVELRRSLIAQAENNPYLSVISVSEVEAGFNQTELRQANLFMQAEIDMGYANNFMESMNYSSAIEFVRRAADNYQKSYTQYYRPQRVAQAWQLLAYALIAQYQNEDEPVYEQLQPARMAFVELIRVAPYLTMLEGRQSPERVKLYDEALELFMGDVVYRQTPRKDAAALSHRHGSDILVMPRIVGDKGGKLFLEMDVYLARTEEMRFLRQALDFPETGQEQYLSDVATSLLSNIYDCLQFELPEVQSNVVTKAHRFGLEVGATYSSHMVHPTESFLNNFGGHVSLTYMLDEHFFIRVQAEVLTVLQDKAHELYSNFEIYQFPISFGLSNDWQWARAYLMLGPNFSFSTDYTIARTTACKTFGMNDIECNPADVSRNHEPFSMLVDFVIGLGVGRDPFYLTLEGIASLTAWPLDSGYFKHMIGARLGLQYWF